MLTRAPPQRTLYPHSNGHYLGMDIHDTGSISGLEQLRAGMVITVEPGVYVPDLPNVPAKYVSVVCLFVCVFVVVYVCRLAAGVIIRCIGA